MEALRKKVERIATPTNLDASTIRSERIICRCLFAGLLLIFLSVWKGDGGYLDLRQYLDNAENLWLKGDLALPAEAGQARRYYIHPLGSAFMSGPFVLLGAAIEKLSGGAIGGRNLAAFGIPVYGTLACLLLYCTGRQLNLPAQVCVWTAWMLGLGSTFLSYTRLFFTEVPMVFCICLAGWAFVHARRTGSLRWTLLCGAGLAGIAACHFNSTFISIGLWTGMSYALFRNASCQLAVSRFRLIAALSLIPALTAAILAYMNKVRFGHPFSTGYESLLAGLEHPFSLSNIPKNFPNFLFWLYHNIWVLPAAWFLRKAWRVERGWSLGIILASVLHLAFMQTYISLRTFPLRHPLPVVAVLSVGLLFFGEWLWRRWQWRGLVYSGLVLCAWNLALFIRADDGTQTFWANPRDGSLNCYAWYMAPAGVDTFGTPMSAPQWAAFLACAIVGMGLSLAAAREAVRLDWVSDR